MRDRIRPHLPHEHILPRAQPASLVPVVLCGGSGTRLWPKSRRLLPKQFLSLVTPHSLLQDTVLRLRPIARCGTPVLVANHEHRFLVAEQLQEIGAKPRALLLEPVGRNTAPAIAAAALLVAAEDPEAILLVLPSDHAIADEPAFRAAVARATAVATEGYLVTFGIVRAFGYQIRTSLKISAGLAQIGEFSFILIALGTSLGLMPPEAPPARGEPVGEWGGEGHVRNVGRERGARNASLIVCKRPIADLPIIVTPDLIRGPRRRCGYGSRIKSGMTK